MSKWKISCSAAIMAAGLAPSAHADQFTKLTLLTFSGPVEVPGISLPAGTYQFSLADPDASRRVVKISDKDGMKTYGMFLSIPNQRMTPSDKPVVMFKETAAGAPPAVQAWFYPGETYGYEFAYPHDQALKIARATHQPVLSYSDRSDGSASDSDRIASMKSGEVTRVDENDKPATESTEARAQAVAPEAVTAPPTAPAQTARAQTPAPAEAPARDNATVGTAGTVSPSSAQQSGRSRLPETGSELPLLALISSLSLAGGFGLRLARKAC